MPSEQMKYDLKVADEVAKKLYDRLERRRKLWERLSTLRQAIKSRAN